MAALRETNVRVLPCVLNALARIALRRGVSRDEAVRQVLAEHTAAQEARQPADRLTHIATVLRYPRPAPRGQKRTDKPLRLRLPEGLADQARAVSLRLPGQHPRAHQDYVARSLTDAVVTAIAVQEPFTDPFLYRLLPVLRHNAALGLWQLAVAATITRPELAIQDQAEYVRDKQEETLSAAEKRLLRISKQLDEEVFWHAKTRFTVVANLARGLLTDDDAGAAKEQWLYEQDDDWDEWRLDLRHTLDKSRWWRGIGEWDADGRGSTAVWRAGRKVDLQDFTDWLLALDGHTPSTRAVAAPGWSLRAPAGWATHVVPRGQELPPRLAQWAAQNRVMAWPVDGRQVVWPLRPGHPHPVPGIEPLAAHTRTLRPEEILEFVEAVLIEWGTSVMDDASSVEVDGGIPYDAEADSPTPYLWLPVDKAFDFGFIDAEQRCAAMAAAYEQAPHHTRTTGEPIVSQPSPGPDPDFTVLVTRRRTSRKAKPMWRWPRGSVAQEIFAGTSPEIVAWLAEQSLWTARRMTHGATEAAWHDGFDHFPRSFWRPGDLPDAEPM
ncbi:hypothetical protein BS329_15280 [Amycolatopsis coloradensis]|uniref:Uncharacterized protein n=1 Tax=Amycolatopsis coloradensis TaxID=76021 RepID=A0A1R0KU16_9PSEU|nr:hypothetical protein [Amycolatopsis coloradensis]OLZ51627.1 hypothetical protein BS329_15280 [Amycolatopsis coloradensis]